MQRPIASEERTRAVEADTVPTINALASPVAEKPSGTLLGLINDSRILLAEEREVADLIASGECRLFEATEGAVELGPMTLRGVSNPPDEGNADW